MENKKIIYSCDSRRSPFIEEFDCGRTYNDQQAFISQIGALKAHFGGSTSLDHVLNSLKPKGYRCPKCSGNGYVNVRYNAYPSGLPDSGCGGEDWRDRKETCNLCKGLGYTEKEYRKRYKTVEDGYELV